MQRNEGDDVREQQRRPYFISTLHNNDKQHKLQANTISQGGLEVLEPLINYVLR